MERLLSARVHNIQPSGIRVFFDQGIQSQDVVSLGVGEPNFATSEKVIAACMDALREGPIRYTSNLGMYELREEIARYLSSSFKLNYNPDQEIIVTVGSSEALDLAFRAVLNAGDEVLIPTPGYVAYEPIVQMHGGKVVEIETLAANSFKLTAEALEAAITPHSKVLMLNYPSNPTGAVMSEEDWLQIAEVVLKHDLVVISDEIYAELTYEGTHASIASLPEMKDRTLVISGFSKAFAMTGWRLGYACGPKQLIAAMLKIHQYVAMCAPTIAQVAALASLREGISYKDEMVKQYDERRICLVSALNEMGLSCHTPQGAFYVFPSIASSGLSSEQFSLRLLKEAKVAVVPGYVFGKGGEGFIRCSYAASPTELEKAIQRIGAFMKSL